MQRTNRLVIRLSKLERQRINELAIVEHIPISTLARRALLQLADDAGVDARISIAQHSGAGELQEEPCHD